MRWAIIDEINRVVSIVEQDERPDRGVKAHDDSNCLIGRYWNGWAFDAPKWSTYDFLQRFTVEELDAVLLASQANPVIRRFLALAEAAHEVIADDPQTVAGINYLVAQGILTSERKSEILDS